MDKSRSIESEEDLRERRKKKGALPLVVFLSFNDRDVHPHCPNASNPYHKCGRHCLHKIPSRWSGTEREKISDRSGVNPNCPNASNHFHKCAHYCFEKMTGNCWDVREQPEKDERALTVADKHDVNPNSKLASSEDILKDCPEEVMKTRGKKMFPTAENQLKSECKNASNPFHVCAEYCFQTAPEVDHPGQVAKLKKLKEKKIAFSGGDITGVNPQCKYASNPFHRCAEYCFQNVTEKNISRGALKSKAKKALCGAERISVNPNCEHASNQYHKCTEYCFQGILEKNQPVQGIPVLIKGKKRGSPKGHPMVHKNSLDTDYVEVHHSSHNYEPSKGITVNGRNEESDSVLIKEEKEVEENMLVFTDAQPIRISVADLFHEWAKYCSLKATEEADIN